MPITLLVADGHPISLDGLRSLADGLADITVVAQARDGEVALTLLERLRPEVAILDLMMPHLTGLVVARRATQTGLPTGIVLHAGRGDPWLVRAAVGAGARGFILKAGPASDLEAAVRAVAAGRTFFSEQLVVPELLGSRRGEPKRRFLLTSRERDVLRLVAEGRGSRQVARALGLTVRTVEWYRLAIMRKLGLDRLAHLVHYAVATQLIGLD